MKAVVINGYGSIEKKVAICEIPLPKIGSKDVLVCVKAAAVNPIDFKIVLGRLRFVRQLDFPAVFGFDFSGIITQIGEEVDDFKIGEAVFGSLPGNRIGAFSEYCAVPASLITRKPENIDFEEAASLPMVGMTVIQCFRLVDFNKTKKILITAGSGGVGSFAIQYARMKGADVSSTTSSSNQVLVKALGANQVFDYTNSKIWEQINDIDIVLDTLGPPHSSKLMSCLKEGGTFINIAGGVDHKTAKQLGVNQFIRLLLRIKRWPLMRFAALRKLQYHYVLMNTNKTDLEEIKSLVKKGNIRPVLDKIYPFHQAVQALKHQESGRAKGKIVIRMED